jgi:general secretion pathway protein D
MDLTNVTIPTLVKYVSDLTGKNFVIDERVRGKVSLMIPSGVAPDEVYRLFLSVLRLKGLTVVQDGPIYQVKPLGEAQGDRSLHIVKLKNANAEEVSKLLTTLTTQGRMVGTGQPGTAAAPMPTMGRLGGTEFEGFVSILADKPTNSLLITASERDRRVLDPIIEQLDTPRRQVFVEATIMEVALDRFRELGGSLTAAGYVTLSGVGRMDAGFNADPTVANQATTSQGGFPSSTPPSATTGSAVTALSPSQFNAKLLLKALTSNSDANVLSAPQILATDGQKARIVVGSNVPFLTGTSQSSGGQTIQTVERRDIGVTLELTPRILDQHQVLLDVRQEISSLVEGASTEILTRLGPSTNKREATTSLIVQSDQTVVIGGLVRDDVTKIVTRVPLLSDIPVIGWLFRNESTKVQKTNLLIFLTPHVIDGPTDLALHTETLYPSPRIMPRPTDPLSEEIWERRLEQLRNAHPVPTDPLPPPTGP